MLGAWSPLFQKKWAELGVLTTILMGPLPWISYAISNGPPLSFATVHLPFEAALRAHITLRKAGCEIISSAVRGIPAYSIDTLFQRALD